MGRCNPFFIVLPVNPDSSPNDAPGVRALAERVLAGMDRDRTSREAVRFLEFVAAGKGIECGAKGHLLTWGYVSNYGNAERTNNDLYPFWKDLWLLDDGPLNFETVLVFCQDEEDSGGWMTRVGLSKSDFKHGVVHILTASNHLELGLLGDH